MDFFCFGVFFYSECVCCNGAELLARRCIGLHFAVLCNCLIYCKIPLLTECTLYWKWIICLLPNKVRILLEQKVHSGLKYSWRSKNDCWLLFTTDCIGFHRDKNWLLKEKPKSLQTLRFGKEGESWHCLMICFHEMSALALKLQSWFDGKLQEAAHLWLTLPSNKKIDLRHNWVDADLIAHTQKA